MRTKPPVFCLIIFQLLISCCLHVLFSGMFHVICFCAHVLMPVTVFRCYGCVDMQSVPSCVQECWELLSSESFFILLSNLTGLRLHYLCGDEDESENEDGKSETENGGGEGNTQASASNTDADTSTTEKKDKGSQNVHVCMHAKINFYIYNIFSVYSCRTTYLCRRTASLDAWRLYIVT